MDFYDIWPTIVMVIIVLAVLTLIFNSVGPKKRLPQLTGFWAQPPGSLPEPQPE